MDKTWNNLPIEIPEKTNYNEATETNLEKEAAKCADELSLEILDEFRKQSSETQKQIIYLLRSIVSTEQEEVSFVPQTIDLHNP